MNKEIKEEIEKILIKYRAIESSLGLAYVLKYEVSDIEALITTTRQKAYLQGAKDMAKEIGAVKPMGVPNGRGISDNGLPNQVAIAYEQVQLRTLLDVQRKTQQFINNLTKEKK